MLTPMSSQHRLSQIAAGGLRAEMSRQRKTSNDLASILHCSQSSASRRMTGETGMDLDEIQTVSDWLGVPIGVLLQERVEGKAA